MTQQDTPQDTSSMVVPAQTSETIRMVILIVNPTTQPLVTTIEPLKLTQASTDDVACPDPSIFIG